MRSFRVTSEETIASTPPLVFDHFTTPDNWVGSHPSTVAVRGETSSPRGLGDSWTELIESPGGRRFEARWRVVRSEPPSIWEIRTENFAGLPASVTITYTLRTGDQPGTHFVREMVTELPDDFAVSDSLARALSSSESHDSYVRAMKRRLEHAHSSTSETRPEPSPEDVREPQGH